MANSKMTIGKCSHLESGLYRLENALGSATTIGTLRHFVREAMIDLYQAQNEQRHAKEYRDVWKRNLLEATREHREKCSGESCCVSVWFLRDMAEATGITFTEDEKLLFV